MITTLVLFIVVLVAKSLDAVGEMTPEYNLILGVVAIIAVVAVQFIPEDD